MDSFPEPQQIFDSSEEEYFLYQNNIASHEELEKIVETFRLPEDVRFLEIGFAGGGLLKYIAERYPRMEIWGLEKKKSFVDKIKSELPRVKILPYAMGGLVAPPRYFDLVWSHLTLCYLLTEMEVLRYSLREIHRVLKKGGIFFFREVTETNSFVHYRHVYASDLNLHSEPKIVPLISGPKWFELLREAGFHVYSYKNPCFEINSGEAEEPFGYVDILCGKQ